MEKIQKFEDHKSINESNWFQKNWNKAVASIKKKNMAWYDFIKELDEKNQMPYGVSVMFAGDTTVYGKQLSKDSSKKIDFEDKKMMQYENVEEDNGMAKVTLESPNRNMADRGLKAIRNAIILRYNARIASGILDALFIWGAPGIGKTEAISQAANKLDLDLIVFHLSQIEPTDFKGVPYVIDQEIKALTASGKESKTKKEVRKRSSFALPLIFPTKDDKGRNPKGGILFFDELNQADEMVLSAALPLMLDGGYNGYDLPPDWIVIAAGNREMDTDVTDLGTPLSGRFAHVNLVPTVEDWSKFAYANEKVDKRLIEFFKNNPDMFFNLVPTRGDNNGPYASPRNWTKASYMVYIKTKGKFDYYGEGIEKDGEMKKTSSREKEIWDEIIYHVGATAATSYRVFLNVISHVSKKEIEEVYTKGVSPKSFETINMVKTPGLLQNIMNVIASEKAGTNSSAMSIPEFKNYIKYAEAFESHEQTTIALKSLSDAAGGSTDSWFRSEPEYMKYWLPLAQKWHLEGEKTKEKYEKRN